MRTRVEPRFFHAANAVHGSIYVKPLGDAAGGKLAPDTGSFMHGDIHRTPEVEYTR